MKIAPLIALGFLASTPLQAQRPAESPRPGGRGVLPGETVASTPAFKGLPVTSEAKEDEPPKKTKGPTQIDSQEATFDQKKNEAVFIGSVVVADPEFNVKCDKLTALLKSADKPKPAVEGGTPKPATPNPATPRAGATPAPTEKKGGGGGLQRAIAEALPGNRVKIQQDKPQPDGTVQKSIGIADKAVYDAVSGDIILSGMPECQQGANSLIATSPATTIVLNRNGEMKAKGPSRTEIKDKGDSGL